MLHLTARVSKRRHDWCRHTICHAIEPQNRSIPRGIHHFYIEKPAKTMESNRCLYQGQPTSFVVCPDETRVPNYFEARLVCESVGVFHLLGKERKHLKAVYRSHNYRR